MFLTWTILAVSLLACAGKKTWPGPPLGSEYPSTIAMQNYFGMHTNALWHLQHSNLLVISVFYDIHCLDCNVLEYFVTENGEENDHRRVADDKEEPRQKKLSAKELDQLRKAIAELPAKRELSPLWKLAVVSHKSGTNWVTHTYNRDRPPLALSRIFNIISEREEAKPKPIPDDAPPEV